MIREFKVNNFDLLRLFAAIEVVLLHSFPRLHIPVPAFFDVMANFPGVVMFFIISGFLISASLDRNHDLKNYFTNRAFRIYPALWICIIFTVITISIATNISFINRQAIPWFLSQCFGFIYTPAFLSKFGFGSYNGSLWTIPLEIQFYIVLPAIYFITSKIAKKENQKKFILIIFFIIFSILSYYIKVNFAKQENEIETLSQKVIRYSFFNSIYLFLFGVILQKFKVYQSKIIFGKGLLWLFAYLLVSYFVPTSDTTYIFKLLFLGVTTISLAYTLPYLANRFLKGNDISYGVYIYHGLVLGVIVQLKLFGNPYYIIVILMVTIILAVLSWCFVEKPVMKRKKKTIHKIIESGII